jgi:hypothetical protein
MIEFDAARYGPAMASLLEAAPLNELGPGKPVTSLREKLQALSIETAFAPHKVVDRKMAQACLAGLWLRFDFLDQSHSISQEIKTATGSFWHGIMHRREPDYDNAKYWFHRAPEHPVYAPLCAAAKVAASLRDANASLRPGESSIGETQQSRAVSEKLSASLGETRLLNADRAADFLTTQNDWDPFRFVDLVAAVARGKSSSEQLCRQIQRREWELLFDYCFRAATGNN